MKVFFTLFIMCSSLCVSSAIVSADDLLEQIRSLNDGRLKNNFLCDLCEIQADRGDIVSATALLSEITISRNRIVAAENIARIQAASGDLESAATTLRMTNHAIDSVEEVSPALLVEMMTAAGLYSEAMTLAKQSSVQLPIECMAGLGDYSSAVAHLQQSGPFAFGKLIDTGSALYHRQGLPSVVALFREYDTSKLELNLGILAVDLVTDSEFDSADAIVSSGMLGAYSTTTKRLSSLMNPETTDFDWMNRDIRRERSVMNVLANRFGAHEWLLIEHARLESSRGFPLNSLHLCRKAEALVPPITAKVRPRDVDSFNDESYRQRLAIAIEYSRSGSFSDAARILDEIRKNCDYDVFLDAVRRVGTVSNASDSTLQNSLFESILQDKHADIAFSLGKLSRPRPLLGRWTSLNLGETLLRLRNDTFTRISANVLQSPEIELAALTQSPTELEKLMTTLIERRSTDDLTWLLWYAPKDFCPKPLLVTCMKMHSPALCILAAVRIARGNGTDDAEVTERLISLSDSDDSGIRYAALSALWQESKRALPFSGLVTRDSDDVDTQILLAMLRGNITPRIIDRTLECSNSWLQGAVAQVVAASVRDAENTASTERILTSKSQYAVFHCGNELLKTDPRNESATNALRVLLQRPSSKEIQQHAEQLITMVSRP